uniref:Pigment dispersing factor n=1 Tax=Meimuna opalifera TaxID=179424 RepID=Q76L38_9HEMI|nr:pigment dispersing factor [Meimuna opalifera]
MRSAGVMIAVLAVCLCLCLESATSLRYQDDKYIESQYGPSTRELASWLLEWAQKNDHAHKRNSEIINSLLGLPKVLNDAGRK